MKKLNLILAILAIFASAAVTANQSEQAKEPYYNPVELIQSAIIKLNQLTSAVTYSPAVVNDLVEQEIAPLFDFNHIAAEVLWVLNVDLNKAQMQTFADKLKADIMATLLAKLSQANSTSINFISARPLINSSIAVKLRVGNYSPFGIFIDLLFHQNSTGTWQIFDVVLNNDSLINYYQKRVLIQARRHGIYKVLGKI
ncbi:MAG: ABC transporter substrate-binding protein [Candidatus Thioglobus sp.]|nr:ABC transporter substrate-binding protein [Candidatus Thioglobus sp.]